MRIRDHIVCFGRNNELSDLLEEWGGKITFFDFQPISGRNGFTFDIFQDDPYYEKACKLLTKNCITLSNFIFTQEELFNAQWLTVRVKNMKFDLAENAISTTSTEGLTGTLSILLQAIYIG